MAKLERILEERTRRQTLRQRTSGILYSVLFHSGLVAAVWFVPSLFAKTEKRFEYISVMVVPPAALGIEEPPPPPPLAPPKKKAAPPPPPPPEPPPQTPAEPIPEDVPVLAKKTEKKPPPKRPPPPPSTAPPPAAEIPPPKRKGSPFGNALGATSTLSAVGVEDPNFTYGFYLNRIVAALSRNWVRPVIGDLPDATLYFRIQRDGTITDLRLVESSTSKEFDDAAMRAVTASSPLPPLPKGYKRDHLGINVIVE